MPASLHERLRGEASRRGLSLNALCVERLGRETGPGAVRSEATASVETAVRQWHSDLIGVVLFGSTARGEAREWSDIDLLFAMDDCVPITRELYRRWDAIAEANSRVSPHFAHPPADRSSPGSLWLEVSMDGIVLYERGGQVTRLLSGLRRLIATGKVECREAYGHRYWILPGSPGDA